MSIENFPKIVGKQEAIPPKAKIEAAEFLDFRSRDLRNADLSDFSAEILKTGEFNTRTIWPKRLPEGFDPEKILEESKNPGLSVRELHEEGITGQGVNVAIIDQKLLLDHEEYADRITHYEETDETKKENASMHGAAVSSLLVGKECGVAPGSTLSYFAVPSGGQTDDYAAAINRIIGYNKNLSKTNKIKVVSVSLALTTNVKIKPEQRQRLVEAIKLAAEENITVIFPGFARSDYDFDFLGTGNATEQKDFTENYGEWLSLKHRGIKMDERSKEKDILVPCDYRTMASPLGPDEYQYGGKGGISWAVPYLAGVFALALQVNPELTKKEILEKIKKTSVKNKKGLRIINPKGLIDLIREEKGRQETGSN